jgi:transcription-repair coupling factor (superfamily II helicase)
MAVRGGLLDVYPSTADGPVRIDWFGDEVEGIRAFSPFTQKTIRPLKTVQVWPAAEPADEVLVDPLEDPGTGDACVVRLQPADYDGALREALERLEDEAAAGALDDPAVLTARLEQLSVLDLRVPAGTDAPAFDVREARFATRGMAEAEAEMARLSGNRQRLVVCFARRGDMERTQNLVNRVKPVIMEPGDRVPAERVRDAEEAAQQREAGEGVEKEIGEFWHRVRGRQVAIRCAWRYGTSSPDRFRRFRGKRTHDQASQRVAGPRASRWRA